MEEGNHAKDTISNSHMSKLLNISPFPGELSIVRKFNHWQNKNRALATVLGRIISPKFLQDISVVTWFLFLVKIRTLGFPYMWNVLGNTVIAVFVQSKIRSPRPQDIDFKLRNFGIGKSNRGFPCIESHMAVVVILPILHRTQGWLSSILLFSYIGFIGAIRVYAAANFPSQVFVSWLTGSVGLLLGNQIHGVLREWEVPHYYHHLTFLFGVTFSLILLAHFIESDDRRFQFGVPKQEYIRVLSRIALSDGQNGHDANIEAPRRSKELSNLRKDSFYYLARRMKANN